MSRALYVRVFFCFLFTGQAGRAIALMRMNHLFLPAFGTVTDLSSPDTLSVNNHNKQ